MFLTMRIPRIVSFPLGNEAFPGRVMSFPVGNARKSMENGIRKALEISACLFLTAFPTQQGLTGLLEPIYPMRKIVVRL